MAQLQTGSVRNPSPMPMAMSQHGRRAPGSDWWWGAQSYVPNRLPAHSLLKCSSSQADIPTWARAKRRDATICVFRFNVPPWFRCLLADREHVFELLGHVLEYVFAVHPAELALDVLKDLPLKHMNCPDYDCVMVW